jgi:hypothetical protein
MAASNLVPTIPRVSAAELAVAVITTVNWSLAASVTAALPREDSTTKMKLVQAPALTAVVVGADAMQAPAALLAMTDVLDRGRNKIERSCAATAQTLTTCSADWVLTCEIRGEPSLESAEQIAQLMEPVAVGPHVIVALAAAASLTMAAAGGEMHIDIDVPTSDGIRGARHEAEEELLGVASPTEQDAALPTEQDAVLAVTCVTSTPDARMLTEEADPKTQQILFTHHPVAPWRNLGESTLMPYSGLSAGSRGASVSVSGVSNAVTAAVGISVDRSLTAATGVPVDRSIIALLIGPEFGDAEMRAATVDRQHPLCTSTPVEIRGDEVSGLSPPNKTVLSGDEVTLVEIRGDEVSGLSPPNKTVLSGDEVTECDCATIAATATEKWLAAEASNAMKRNRIEEVIAQDWSITSGSSRGEVSAQGAVRALIPVGSHESAAIPQIANAESLCDVRSLTRDLVSAACPSDVEMSDASAQCHAAVATYISGEQEEYDSRSILADCPLVNVSRDIHDRRCIVEGKLGLYTSTNQCRRRSRCSVGAHSRENRH